MIRKISEWFQHLGTVYVHAYPTYVAVDLAYMIFDPKYGNVGSAHDVELEPTYSSIIWDYSHLKVVE